MAEVITNPPLSNLHGVEAFRKRILVLEAARKGLSVQALRRHYIEVATDECLPLHAETIKMEFPELTLEAPAGVEI